MITDNDILKIIKKLNEIGVSVEEIKKAVVVDNKYKIIEGDKNDKKNEKD